MKCVTCHFDKNINKINSIFSLSKDMAQRLFTPTKLKRNMWLYHLWTLLNFYPLSWRQFTPLVFTPTSTLTPTTIHPQKLYQFTPHPPFVGCSTGHKLSWGRWDRLAWRPPTWRGKGLTCSLENFWLFPFLPGHHIRRAFDRLRQKSPDVTRFIAFMEYGEDSWIETSRWSVHEWSITHRL